MRAEDTDREPSLEASNSVLKIGSELRQIYSQMLRRLAVLNLLYWVLPIDTYPSDFAATASGVLPLIFAAILLHGGMKALRLGRDLIWTGYVWFPLQALTFYALGPLVYVFGSDGAQQSLSTHFLAVDTHELLRAHMLSTLGVTGVLFGMLLQMRIRWHRIGTYPELPAPLGPLGFGVASVGVGAAFKYLVLLPVEWSGALTVPGLFSSFGNLVDLGFAVLAFCAAQRNSLARIMMFTLWPLHLLLSVLTFSKLQFALAILLPIVGAHLGSGKVRRLVFSGTIALAIYLILQPVAAYGRAQVFEATGTISEAGYLDRSRHVTQYVSEGRILTGFQSDEEQRWWQRLSLAGPQAAAMRLHDEGIEGDTLENIPLYFVPRLLWPGKPNVVGPGQDFYLQAGGNTSVRSFLPTSIYGDFYWNAGWIGVLIGPVLVGVLFGQIAQRSLAAVRCRELLLLPAVLLGLQTTLLGPNKFISNGIVGPAVIYFGYVGFVVLLLRSIRSPLLGHGADKAHAKSAAIMLERKT